MEDLDHIVFSLCPLGYSSTSTSRSLARFCHGVYFILLSYNNKDESGSAHSYILRFCRGFENLYGRSLVTPNMHLHTHILECILDYGPVYSFWLFSFERYNGILGVYKTNQRSIEIQLMRKFDSQQCVKDLSQPKEFENIFLPVLSRLNFQHSGSLLISMNNCANQKLIETVKLAIGPVKKSETAWEMSSNDNMYECCPPFSRQCLEFDDVQLLKGMNEQIFNDLNMNSVTGNFDRFSSVKFAGEIFGSRDSGQDRSCFIMARWCRSGGNVDLSGDNLRPGIVDHFIRQNVQVNGRYLTCFLALVRWFSEHPLRHKMGAPT